jgi:hypothetical protein
VIQKQAQMAQQTYAEIQRLPKPNTELGLVDDALGTANHDDLDGNVARMRIVQQTTLEW